MFLVPTAAFRPDRLLSGCRLALAVLLGLLSVLSPTAPAVGPPPLPSPAPISPVVPTGDEDAKEGEAAVAAQTARPAERVATSARRVPPVAMRAAIRAASPVVHRSPSATGSSARVLPLRC